MENIAKLLALLLAATMSITALTGCGNKNEEEAKKVVEEFGKAVCDYNFIKASECLDDPVEMNKEIREIENEDDALEYSVDEAYKDYFDKLLGLTKNLLSDAEAKTEEKKIVVVKTDDGWKIDAKESEIDLLESLDS